MSDTSEDEDLSKFRDAVDNTFMQKIANTMQKEKKPKSERYLEISSHYNDIKVPEQMQKQIGCKVSAVISKIVEYSDVVELPKKKRKIKGGVKLFKDSESYLSCEEPKDTYTENHNREAKKIKYKRQHVEETDNVKSYEILKQLAVSGDYILSKVETKCWKSRRKEKIFKYKRLGKSNICTAIEF